MENNYKRTTKNKKTQLVGTCCQDWPRQNRKINEMKINWKTKIEVKIREVMDGTLIIVSLEPWKQ